MIIRSLSWMFADAEIIEFYEIRKALARPSRRGDAPWAFAEKGIEVTDFKHSVFGFIPNLFYAEGEGVEIKEGTPVFRKHTPGTRM